MPGPIMLIGIMVASVALLIHIAIVRAVYRINEQIRLLTEIRDLLRQRE